MSIVRSVRSFFQHYSFILPLFIFFLLVIGFVLILSQVKQQQDVRSRAAGNDCIVDSGNEQTDSEEQKMLDLINAYRQQHNAGPLAFSPSLIHASSWMSADMAQHNNFNHTDTLGRNPFVRITDCGYTNYHASGENIASGNADAQTTFSQWQESPGHNANMLNPNFHAAGIARYNYDASTYKWYWTLDLGDTVDGNLPGTSSVPLTSAPSTSPTVITPSPTSPPAASPTIILSKSPTITFFPTPTPDPNDVTLQLTLQITGIGGPDGNKTPRSTVKQIQVSVLDTSNQVVKIASAAAIYDGTQGYSALADLGPAIKTGYYTVKVSSPNTLQALVTSGIQHLAEKTTNKLSPVTLLPLDFNEDNVLSLKDYNFFVSCFAVTTCSKQELLDINSDGIIDIMDYNLLLKGFTAQSGD